MRGELKLMENVMAFFIIIILGMIAFIYFATAQGADARDQAEESANLRAIQIARSLYNMPELSCTFTQTGRCIEAEKALIFSGIISTDVYFPVLSQSRIAVNCIGCEEIVVYDLLDSTSYRQIHVPIVVYNATSRIRHFGWIEVRV
jgi:hypothetical protein